MQNNGLSPSYALVHRSIALDQNLYRTSSGGTASWTGHWGTATGVCQTTGVGGVAADGSVSTWLRASGDWGSWVVY